MREHLGITLEPVAEDPLPAPSGMRPWEPWPPRIAARGFLVALRTLCGAAERGAGGPRHRAEVETRSPAGVS